MGSARIESANRPASAYQISSLDRSHHQKWDQFVLSCERGTFFHRVGWRSVFENALGHEAFYLLCKCDGQIKGVLPLVHMRSRLFGNALISLPFLVYGGVLAVDNQAEDLLVDEAKNIADRLNVEFLELRSKNSSRRQWPTDVRYVTFKKRLSDDPDANLLAIPRKQRAMIRKAMKHGLQERHDINVNQFHTILSECKRNLGTPFFNKKYFECLIDAFEADIEILTVMKGQSVLSSVMSFRFRDEILPYYGGGGSQARIWSANDFMYWKLMEKVCQDGVSIFDFGRSRVDTGAYRFKKHWGFQPTPLNYEYCLVKGRDLPNINPENPKYRIAINAWKRLPLSVAKTLGPPLARRLA